MKLNELQFNPGAVKKRKRLGRGDSSGHGSTSTKGNKGCKARSGFSSPGNFEGGQMPLIRRLPKRGFKSFTRTFTEIVNLEQLEAKFPSSAIIAPEDLINAGLVKKDLPVKILGRGKLSKNFEVKAHFFSKKAKESIEKAGGKTIILSRNSKGKPQVKTQRAKVKSETSSQNSVTGKLS